MALATNLGYPRIGARRELKKAIESYWKGDISANDLIAAGSTIRKSNWQTQKDAGLDMIPVGDFSFYDHVLDMTALLGVIPKRYGFNGDLVDLDTYFAMARGHDTVTAMEMTKWFDTNYHYIVPEFDKDTSFKILSSKIFDETAEAQSLGIKARPVLIGPVTYLSLGKAKDESNPFDLLPKLLPVYAEILGRLKSMGVEWVQIDEPILAMDLTDIQKDSLKTSCAALSGCGVKICLATYFCDLRDNESLALSLPFDALHIDLKRAPDQLGSIIKHFPKDKILSLGLIDGRNIWKADLHKAFKMAHHAQDVLGSDHIWIAPSCSMIHSPNDLDLETRMDDQLKSWLAFSKQKLSEIRDLTTGLNNGESAISSQLEASDAVVKDRATSSRIHNKDVEHRIKTLEPSMFARHCDFDKRRLVQHAALDLPTFPTTSIGSFPQTKEIREARAALKKGTLSLSDYEHAMKDEILRVIRFQENLDMDVLVHGEPERNDMVEYFGEQLQGYTFSQNGWVQSYGSRYVKPPIIFGDVSRPHPMTVEWSSYAQSLTDRPVKGMLTGPITMLFWSFVRDDQPRSVTCKQIALAIRDEVVDLEKAGIKVIQIDEPAIREGLPLRRSDWEDYLAWAVDSFRLSSSGVADETQIHTHMCYSEFNDIIDSIADLDADAISIETSRSQMELLEAFVNFDYPNEIGPGVYDIHSPRIPSQEEMIVLLEKAATVLDPSQIWVNPDCGLKTRGWAEVEPALKHMVEAAKTMRGRVS
ncbi:MAG: 5-methyltetrahydropteroyltriglutamate--homocysteine S-methyltransferase [Alphaproteobacteria bacterium CG1_02_46_17]|nr:MAG: 5-methyltetrahydropteroyltriglutamate--homocysteine S-methyltransferase [Alphaproteobacteria bacterium CG1_02_46_17]